MSITGPHGIIIISWHHTYGSNNKKRLLTLYKPAGADVHDSSSLLVPVVVLPVIPHDPTAALVVEICPTTIKTDDFSWGFFVTRRVLFVTVT